MTKPRPSQPPPKTYLTGKTYLSVVSMLRGLHEDAAADAMEKRLIQKNIKAAKSLKKYLERIIKDGDKKSKILARKALDILLSGEI
jgi:hypothetical protein